jgi:hypothetical protein
MDIQQEGQMALFEDSYQSKLLENFFKERFSLIQENKYPLMLIADPPSRFVMHLIPEKSQEITLDIKRLERHENFCHPMGAKESYVIPEFNFDGIFFSSIRHEKYRYTQVFRDSKIEAVVVIGQGDDGLKNNFLSLFTFQKNMKKCLSNYLSVYNKFSVPGPYFLFLRLLYIENVRLDPKDIAISGYDAKGHNKPVVRDHLIFPHYRLDHANIDLNACLLPFFDILWNIFGFRGAPDL